MIHHKWGEKNTKFRVLSIPISLLVNSVSFQSLTKHGPVQSLKFCMKHSSPVFDGVYMRFKVFIFQFHYCANAWLIQSIQLNGCETCWTAGTISLILQTANACIINSIYSLTPSSTSCLEQHLNNLCVTHSANVLQCLPATGTVED